VHVTVIGHSVLVGISYIFGQETFCWMKRPLRATLRRNGEVTMNRFHVVAAAAAVLVAMSGPSFAAKKKAQQMSSGYSQSQSSAGAMRHSQGSVHGAFASGGQFSTGRSGNLPYPDRPYGDPGRW
jgi:hypothetical protein